MTKQDLLRTKTQRRNAAIATIAGGIGVASAIFGFMWWSIVIATN